MASSSALMKTLPLLALVLALSLSVRASPGGISCEDLERDECAFAVSSTGQRCVLEKGLKRSGEESLHCRASFVYAGEGLKNWVESAHCVQACGLNRNTLGISSDSLMQKRFTQSLCSPPCFDACPNVVDLYFNLAAGEGVSLPQFCVAQKSGFRRGLGEFLSSSKADSPSNGLSESLADGPVTDDTVFSRNLAEDLAPAPAEGAE